MDNDRFDDLSRKIAQPRTRRESLKILGAAVAGLVFGRSAEAAPKADKPSKCYGGGSHCTNGKQCCSGICTNRQCEPEIPPECAVGTDCPGSDTECEVRTCTDGICGTSFTAAGTACATGFCNGNGQCVECLANADCASGICENNACSPSCLTDPLLGTPCTAGLGACLRDGVYVCSGDGLTVVCDAVAGAPSAEICNGIDDDCDGIVDEGALCPPLLNATSVCQGGQCVLGQCQPGFANCNGNPADGCETNIMVSNSNCGACGSPCFGGPHMSAMCQQGVCNRVCEPGYKNCNGSPNDGCECPPNAVCQGLGCCLPAGQVAGGSIPCCGGEIFGLCV